MRARNKGVPQRKLEEEARKLETRYPKDLVPSYIDIVRKDAISEMSSIIEKEAYDQRVLEKDDKTAFPNDTLRLVTYFVCSFYDRLML